MRTTLLTLATILTHLASHAMPLPAQAPGRRTKPLDLRYLRDHALTRGFMLGRPVKPKPTPDGRAVLFLRARARKPKLSLYEFDLATRKTRELLTPEKLLEGAEEHLTPEEKARRERQRISVGGFTSFGLSEDGRLVLLSLSGRLYLLDRETGKVRELPTGKGTLLDPKFSPDGKMVSYVRDHDLYVLDLKTMKERPVTTGGSETKTHGRAEFVAQEEMRRYTGYWWSPDSRSLAYEEADAEGVEVWHVADPVHPDNKPHPTFYPRPGKANVKVRLGVVPVSGGETVWVRWDAKKYPYLARVVWKKEGPLTLAVENRLQTELVLLKADPATGKTTKLLTERDAAWLNLHTDRPRWLPDGTFLWTAEAPDGPRLEHHGKDAKLLRVLVGADAGYRGLVDVDGKQGWVVYRASKDPTQVHLFRISLEGGEPEALTEKPGLHDAVFSEDHSVFVHEAYTPGAMPTSTVRKADGSVVAPLPSVAEEPPFVPRMEFVKVGAAPGYHGLLVRPHDFDPARRYPVIVHVYGGPLHQVVTRSMHRRLLDQWLADQGFVVVAIDNRGTPGRGRDWERAVSRKFGSVPLEDQVKGLKALGKRFPELDLKRVGIYGWSFGGYMSALAVLRRPDVFHAGVAGAPVVDWLDYDTHYTERYLGLPESDAAAYKEGSLLTYARDLKRPLLLVHGTADDNVYFRHTLKLANALFRAGKDFDLLPLPGLTHMVPEPVVMQQLHARIARFFHEHLGRPESAAGGR
jgi:dipeptidyl-peptidase-4